MIVRAGWRVVVTIFFTQLHTYASNGADNASYHKNCSIATAADCHVTVEQNAVFKQLQTSS